MPSEKYSTTLKPGSKPLNPVSSNKLPPLENLSLKMPLEENKSEETKIQEKDTGTSNAFDDLLQEHIRTPKFKKFERQTLENIQKIGGLIAPFSPGDALIIIGMSEERAKEITDYAEVNTQFYNALNNIYSASPLVAMITGLGYLGMALLSNHGINPIENMLKKRLDKNGKGGIPEFPKPLQA